MRNSWIDDIVEYMTDQSQSNQDYQKQLELDLQQEMNSLCGEAKERAFQNGIELDFSNESITTLKVILDDMYNEAQMLNLTENEYQDMAEVWGAYLGTTLIKNLNKGVWGWDESRRTYFVKLEGVSLYFPTEVYQALKTGLTQNILNFYLDAYNRYSPIPMSR